MENSKQEEIVIVGGGICGLATALALHRKGIKSIVLEKSDTLRSTGVGIIMQPNGWRALDQLGVGSILRETAILIQSGHFISVHDGKQKEITSGRGERRCLKRADLVKALADNLPNNTIHFDSQVKSIEMDPITSYPILYLQDGSVIKAKIVIGCDGVNSVVGRFLGLNSPKLSPACVTRGFSYYQNGHECGNEFLLLSYENHAQLGTVPVTDKLIYWFLTRKWTSEDSEISRNQNLIKESALESLKDFPEHAIEMMKKSDLESFHLTDLRYRAPWDILRSNFRKGTVTVAGDAMHAMGPFLAQGGSASLEDAVILARCLAEKMENNKEMVEEGLDEYLKLRKMRVFWLCLQTYLIGTSVHPPSLLIKVLCIFLLIILFRDPNSPTNYDCRKHS